MAEKLFEYYATGLYSIRELIKKIKQEGLLIVDNFPKSSKLTTLTSSSVHRILRNPFYKGEFCWKEKLHRGTHKPLISQELWEKVQNVLDKYKNKKPSFKYNSLKFAFKGLMSCGECGRTITAVRKTKPSGREYVYYYCTKFETNCSQKPANEKELDKQISSSLDNLQIPDATVAYITEALKNSLNLKRNTAEKTKEQLEAQKIKLEKRLDILYEDRLDSEITKKFYDSKAQEYEAKIKDLEAKISQYTDANLDYYKLGSNILELANKASFLYKNANIDEKRELLNFLLLNPQLKDKNLDIAYKKPFDKIYQRAFCSDWRGRWDLNPRSSA